MAQCPTGGSHHRIAYFGHDIYTLSWRYATKLGRLLRYRTMTRDTNRKGAERFAKKWDVAMPPESTP